MNHMTTQSVPNDRQRQPLRTRLDGPPKLRAASARSAGRRARLTAMGALAAFVAAACNVSTPSTPTTTPDPDHFNVTLRTTGVTGGALTAFNSAVARWEEAVVADVPDIAVAIPAGACGSGSKSVTGTVDDIVIDARISSIDGVGGTLGYAGPCYIRSGSSLPINGVMVFDTADVAFLLADGQFDEVVLHEMGHVLGIGTLWEDKDLLTGNGTSDPRFVGAGAVAEWNTLGGSGDVPVEADGGEGTAYGHWDEETFQTELMTGYLSTTNALSRMTIASLADLGYGVDLDVADPYSLPGGGAALRAPAEDLNLDPFGPVGRI